MEDGLAAPTEEQARQAEMLRHQAEMRKMELETAVIRSQTLKLQAETLNIQARMRRNQMLVWLIPITTLALTAIAAVAIALRP